MHLNDQIEEYSFTHGKHFDVSTGQYDLLMPHDLSRPLTHEEMDYNFIYQKQTLNGFRIFGSGTNLRLNSDDLNKVLKFHQITPADADYSRYISEGYVDNQYIWVPEELVAAPSAAYVSLTGPGTVNEGNSILFTVNTQNFFQSATVAYELDFTQSTATAADFVGATSGTVSMAANGTGSFSVTTATDLVVDSGETFLVKLVGSDSNGVPTNGINTTATITDIAFPTYTTFTGPNTVQEGNTVTYTLSGTTIPNGATVGYVITGVDVNDISLASLTGIITMNGGSGTVSFDVLEDYSSEGTETLTITTLGQDSANNSTGLPKNASTIITEAASGYSLTGPSSITEGTTETYTFTASNIPAGTDFYWELRNSGGAPNVQFAQDLTSARTGTITVQTNGNNVSATFDITAALDMDTEPGENFEVVVYANNTFYDVTPPHDSPITNALAQKNVAIIDLAPDYTIVASPSQTEPSTLVAELYTQYVAAGTAYTWEVVPTGANPVEAADFVGGVLPSGSGTIPTYNSANAQSDTFDISVIADNTTEYDPEQYKIIVKVNTISVAEKTVDVTDTSQTPAAVVYSMAVSPISIVENTTAQYMEFTVSTSQADNILPPAGTTVGYTIDGDWSQQDISVIGIGNSSPATLTGGMTNPYTGSFELDGNGQGSIRVYGIYDQLTEGGEDVTVTLAANDSASNATGGANATGTINDAAAQVWQITGPNSHNEGTTLTFEVKTQNVPAQAYTYATFGNPGSGPASANDFVGGVLPSGSGSVSANHGSLTTDGTHTIEVVIDALVEGIEFYTIELYKANGSLVATHFVQIVDITQTFDCTDAGLTVDDGLTGQTVTGSLSSTGTIVSFNPSTYQSGNTQYTAQITAPANDTNGNPYSNGGATIPCTDTANGADITFALSNNGPVIEGQNITWTLTTANVANGTVVPFALTGTASSPQDYSNVQPFEFTVNNNTATYTVTAFADNLTELGSETVIVTLAANDSAGNATGSIASTATINDTSQSPTWDCNDSGMVINPGNVGDAVNFSINSGVVQSVNPTTYPLGTTYFTVLINAPATDPNGIAYSNAGQTVACSIPGIGTAPEEAMYWIHWGNGDFPHAQDLEGSGPFFYEATGGNTSETTIAPILNDMIANPSQWTVWTGASQNTITDGPSGDTFSFPAAAGGSFYYIIIPDSYGTPDLTQVGKLAENGGNPGTAASKLSLTINGYPCTMYKLTSAASTAPLTLQYV